MAHTHTCVHNFKVVIKNVSAFPHVDKLFSLCANETCNSQAQAHNSLLLKKSTFVQLDTRFYCWRAQAHTHRQRAQTHRELCFSVISSKCTVVSH